jgi:hypothetical protein
MKRLQRFKQILKKPKCKTYSQKIKKLLIYVFDADINKKKVNNKKRELQIE